MKYLANRFIWFYTFSLFVLPSYADSTVSISMLDSDPASITLAFSSADIQSSDIMIEDQLYQNIHMPGTGSTHEPSKPQVPFRGVLLAVPDGADIELELLDFELETFAGYLLFPTPFTDSFDEAAYNTDEFWPKSPVELGIVGYIRDQRVAQIQFYPVQHNPVREEINVYKRMLIRVSFSGGSMANIVGDRSFDRLLARLLINDGDINRVVQPKQQPSICPEPNEAAFKVLVEKDGMYALGYDDLLAAGMDMDNVDPRFIQMTLWGVEVPIQITGEKDGHFDRKDKLIFYGEAMTGVFTRTNVYWLSINPQGGARMGVRKSKHRKKGWRNALRLNSFRSIARMEMDAIYWSYLPNGDGQDHWFWEQLEGGQSLDMSVPLDNRADSSEMAIIRVMLYGKSNDYAHNPDHHTKVFLNGNEIDDELWDGQGNFVHEVTVPHDSLLDGENIVTLTSVGDTEAVVDKLYVNYVEIDFIDSYTAENGQLKFDAEGNGKYIFDVGNFTRKKVSVFDVTDPYNVVRIKKVKGKPDNNGFSLQIGERLDGKRIYLALSLPTEQFLKPSSI
ncbi:MAG: C25 family peptidase propeptide domain-containing protein, partial [Pseudomonadota bacterium]